SGSASSRNWRNTSSSNSIQISASDFISYLKSRTLIKTAQNLEEISQTNLNRQAVLFSSSLTIDDSNKAIFNNRSLVILVNGNLNISVNGSFLPENSNLAFLINGALAFSPSTAQAKGIFLANSVNTGATSNQGLKIIGNLIAQNSFINSRQWADSSRPSLYCF
ncbi:MAG: hypothetical protein N2049_10310, partial [Anaerolineales bacterium]|nr:hypothetical protein [Anaerolineales bacterium]